MKKLINSFQPEDVVLVVIIIITGALVLAGKNGSITDIFKAVITVFLYKKFIKS